MIVVVEGISAARRAWCREHAAGHVVEEQAPVPDAPDRRRDPEAAAQFWTDDDAALFDALLHRLP
jgi:hypothetical protein